MNLPRFSFRRRGGEVEAVEEEVRDSVVLERDRSFLRVS